MYEPLRKTWIELIEVLPQLFLPKSPIQNFEMSTFYASMLSTTEGIKLGGYPSWRTASQDVYCTCGIQMQLLLTLDPGWSIPVLDQNRWLWIQNRTLVEHAKPMVFADPGMSILSPGMHFIFACLNCADTPTKHVRQNR